MKFVITIPIILILLLIPIQLIDGLEIIKITGQDENSKIVIEFNDNQLITYSLTLNDDNSNQIFLESIDPKLKIKDYGFYIIDRANGIFIVGKNIEDKKWIIVSKIKIDSERITKKWIMDIEPVKTITGQRDLFTENNKMEPIIEDSIKENREYAKKQLEEKLDRLDKENNKWSKTEVKVDYDKYEEYKKTIFDRNENNTKPEIIIKEEKDNFDNKILDILIDYYEKVDINENFKFTVKTFDGNIDNVLINVKFKNTDGIIIKEFSGKTKDGKFDNEFRIKENIWAVGTYTLEVNASLGEQIVDKSKSFFVLEMRKNSFNNPPVAKILPITPIITSNQTQTIIDEINTEFDITATKTNSTHFKGSPYFTINNENNTKSQYVNYEQLKSLFNNTNTEIVKQDKDDNLIWVLNQIINIELDGSESYDYDDHMLNYIWKLINPENNNYKIDESLLTGVKPIIPVNVTDIEIFEFELIVSDGRKQSIPVYATATVYNGTVYDNNYEKIGLD